MVAVGERSGIEALSCRYRFNWSTYQKRELKGVMAEVKLMWVGSLYLPTFFIQMVGTGSPMRYKRLGQLC